MARNRAVRIGSAVLPVLMAVAVVATANHYVVDGVVGAVVAVSGLALAHVLAQARRRRSATFAAAVLADDPELLDELDVVEDEPVDAP
jgi:hypothetical protein